jgi:hypothetical protein
VLACYLNEALQRLPIPSPSRANRQAELRAYLAESAAGTSQDEARAFLDRRQLRRNARFSGRRDFASLPPSKIASKIRLSTACGEAALFAAP